MTEYSQEQLPLVLEACERMEHHLTAAVVSNDIQFVQHVLANTVNGTTYTGIRARTTGVCDCGCAGLGRPQTTAFCALNHNVAWAGICLGNASTSCSRCVIIF